MNVQSKGVSRRQILKWGSLGASTALLAACAPQVVTQQVEVTRQVEVEVTRQVEVEKTVEVEKKVEVQVTAAPEAATLNVLWANWGDLYNGLMENVGVNYTATNPNVTVKWEFNQEWKAKLLTMIAAGTPPDMNYVNLMTNSSLANEGALLPLDSYMVLTGLKREDFITAQWDASMWDGKLYACPGGADFLALFYNEDVMVDAGLDPKKPPASADEFIQQSLAILQKDSSGTITRLGWSPDAYQYKQWGFLFGGEWYDYRNQKVTADNPANIEALNWIKSYVDKLDPDQLTAFTSSQPGFYSPGNTFATKKSGYQYDGFWAYDALDQYAPDIKYGVGFYPTKTGKPEERKDYWIQGWMVAMPANGKQPDATWDFLSYGFVDEAWKTGCDTLNGNCVIAQMPKFEECLATKLGPENRITPYLNVFADTGLIGTKFWPAMPVNALYDEEVTRAYDFVIRGEKTAEQALAEVNQTVQAELDKVLSS